MYVDVEDGVVERPHIESGFLARFAQGDRKGIGVSVAVTPGLQPAPELGVVRKEHAVACHVHDPRRARDVADTAGTVETVGVRVDEGIEACDGRRLLRPSLAVCGEECFQSVAVHLDQAQARGDRPDDRLLFRPHFSARRAAARSSRRPASGASRLPLCLPLVSLPHHGVCAPATAPASAFLADRGRFRLRTPSTDRGDLPLWSRRCRARFRSPRAR